MTTVVESTFAPGRINRVGGWLARNGPVLAIVAVIFALWELGVWAFHVQEYVLPSPSVIVHKIVVSWQLPWKTPSSPPRRSCSASG
jgi:ABC-type nitrate/sulfonate/bicarbonate transport system permease component